MRPSPFSLPGLAACSLPADTARAAGCDSLTPLHFPGGAGSTVLEGTVSPGQRLCWTLRLEAGHRLDLRLTSAGGGAAVEVLSQARHATRTRSGTSSFASSSVSTSSVSNSAGMGETRLSVGPQSPGGEFLIALGAVRGAATSYRLEVTLR